MLTNIFLKIKGSDSAYITNDSLDYISPLIVFNNSVCVEVSLAISENQRNYIIFWNGASCQGNHRTQTYAWNNLRISEATAYAVLQRQLKNEIRIPCNNKIIAFVYKFIDTLLYIKGDIMKTVEKWNQNSM